MATVGLWESGQDGSVTAWSDSKRVSAGMSSRPFCAGHWCQPGWASPRHPPMRTQVLPGRFWRYDEAHRQLTFSKTGHPTQSGGGGGGCLGRWKGPWSRRRLPGGKCLLCTASAVPSTTDLTGPRVALSLLIQIPCWSRFSG